MRPHNPDTSYARLRIERDSLTASFAYDVTSLVLVDPALDVDGRIGGFTFQWAWASGFVAGTAAAALLVDPAAAAGSSRITAGPSAPSPSR